MKRVDQEKLTKQLIEAMQAFDIEAIKRILSADFELTLTKEYSSLYYGSALHGVFKKYPDQFAELVEMGLQPEYDSDSFTTIFCNADKPELVRLFIKDEYQKDIALRYAIRSNNRELQQHIIEMASDEEKAALLCFAIAKGEVDTVRLLHASGADQSLQPSYQIVDTWKSLILEHTDKFSEIINLGVKPDIHDTVLTTVACQTNNHDIIRLFMNSNKQLNAILTHSIYTDNLELFQEVMAHKPSSINDEVIIEAVREGRLEMLKLLDVPLNDKLLFTAAEYDHLDVFEYLLSKELDIKVTTHNKNLPTFLLNDYIPRKTLSADQLNICKRFAITDVAINDIRTFAMRSCSLEGLEFVKPIVQASEISYQTFLEASFSCALKIQASADVFTWLLQEGVNLENITVTERVQQQNSGFNLLHAAAYYGAGAVIPFLLQRGFSVHDTTANGYTPLHYARSESAVIALCEHGADVNAKSATGFTPVHVAIDSEGVTKDCPDGKRYIYYGEALAAMVAVPGFDPKMVDDRGNSYIHWLMQQPGTLARGYLDGGAKAVSGEPNQFFFKHVLNILLAAGVDINAKNIYGATAIDLAESSIISEVLVEHGAKARPESCEHPTVKDINSLRASFVFPEKIADKSSYLMFQCAVAAFKEYYGIESLQMLHDFSNPAAKAMRACFLTFPAIANYLARYEITIENGIPVITEHEKCFYSLPHFASSSNISYRCYNSDKNFDECLMPVFNGFENSFFYCTDKARQTAIFAKVLKQSACKFEAQGIRVKSGEIQKVLDRVQLLNDKKDGYLFVVFSTGHPVFAIVDLKKNETVAIILSDPHSQYVHFPKFTDYVNEGRDEANRFFCLNASHSLEQDGNTGERSTDLYNFAFKQALIQCLGRNDQLRASLTKYSKEELAADPEKQVELVTIIRDAMKPYLPQYYVAVDQGADFETRDLTEVANEHQKLRWMIGSEIIKSEQETAENAFAKSLGQSS